MHLSPLSIFIGGQAAELFEKVLLIIITLLYAAIALAIQRSSNLRVQQRRWLE